jgi:hypothetical protein
MGSRLSNDIGWNLADYTKAPKALKLFKNDGINV